MDLFEDDKRLFLKPVLAFADCLMSAYADGPCSCVRCKDDDGSQAGYTHLHTVDIEGGTFSRRFAISSYSDVRGALARAWESFYKTVLPEGGRADMGAIAAFVQGAAARRIELVLYAAGVIKDVDGAPHFMAGEA
ncbi:MAG: hypothetical protein K0S85_104 [Pseudomonas orientalis]|nr:hypothetical protein [Pseudomonas orientalis]